jgi:hypothetical protein
MLFPIQVFKLKFSHFFDFFSNILQKFGYLVLYFHFKELSYFK